MNETLAGWEAALPAGLAARLAAPGSPGPAALALAAAAAAALAALLERARFARWSRGARGAPLPGPPGGAAPFLGAVVRMVRDPAGFWEAQRRLAPCGVSWNSLLGRYILLITDAEQVHAVLTADDPAHLRMALHPSAKTILGADSLCFSAGAPHKALRRSFLALFTRKALSTYVQLQDGIIRRHVAEWLAEHGGREVELRPLLRRLNLATSQEVFVGPYLEGAEAKARFSAAYQDITDAFLGFPLCAPGTAVWRGRAGRRYVVRVLAGAAVRARAHAAAGGAPRCLLDFWARRCAEEAAAVADAPPPAHTADGRMADAMLEFLFASQDASTASLCWTVALLADRPAVLARVRVEQAAARRAAGAAGPLDAAALAQLHYTRQVVKEILRFRPPAPMVPHEVVGHAGLRLGPDAVAPRGALLFPHLGSACAQGFPDAGAFDPDRFSPERREDLAHARNDLVFGAGPHYCVGKEYAINQLTAFLAILATGCDWARRRTPRSDELLYLPTIHPRDTLITLTARPGGGFDGAAAAAGADA